MKVRANPLILYNLLVVHYNVPTHNLHLPTRDSTYYAQICRP